MKSSCVISHANVELVPNGSETVCVSIIRGECGECCVCILYIYIHKAIVCPCSDCVGNSGWGQVVSDILSQPGPQVEQLARLEKISNKQHESRWPIECSRCRLHRDRASLSDCPPFPILSGLGHMTALHINIACKHNTHQINPWGWRHG